MRWLTPRVSRLRAVCQIAFVGFRKSTQIAATNVYSGGIVMQGKGFGCAKELKPVFVSVKLKTLWFTPQLAMESTLSELVVLFHSTPK